METLPPATAGQNYSARLGSSGLTVYINGQSVQASVSQVGEKWFYKIDGIDVVKPGPIQFRDGDQVVAEAEIL